MKFICLLTVLFTVPCLSSSLVHAQQDASSCKVISKDLVGDYTGDCKNGLADGKGEAKGFYHYTGAFKNGMPNGNGICYYGDTVYYSGNFQDGRKEGKGEKHYLRKAMPDSVIKGYWSADEFRGPKYTTYKFISSMRFDRLEIIPSEYSGNSVTIEVATGSGSPNGAPSDFLGHAGYILTLKDLMSPIGCIVKSGINYVSAYKSSSTYELAEFPCKLLGTFSNGETFELELYKSANWKVRFFINK